MSRLHARRRRPALQHLACGRLRGRAHRQGDRDQEPPARSVLVGLHRGATVAHDLQVVSPRLQVDPRGRNDALRDMSSYSTAWFIPTKAGSVTPAPPGCGAISSCTPEPSWPICPPTPVRCCPSRHCQTPLPAAARRSSPTPSAPPATLRRATGTFKLPESYYPGDKRINKAAINRCPALTSSRTFHWTWRAPGHLGQ